MSSTSIDEMVQSTFLQSMTKSWKVGRTAGN